MEQIRQRIADAIRREREASGIAPAELARRAGVSKATISQLENGTGNPTVETLWAIGAALGVPFATLVAEPERTSTLVRAGGFAGVPSAAAPYVATLISASPPGARRDLYLIQAEPGTPHRSVGHQAGTVEHVLLLTGAATVGPDSETERLSPGDYLVHPGDVPHSFEALSPATTAVLITEIR